MDTGEFNPKDLRLHTGLIGQMPVINHFMGRLHLHDILSKYLGAQNSAPSSVECITILVQNILMSREPIYGISEWAGKFPPVLIGIDHTESLNDDRIGRSLERLFDSDRASLLTEIVVHAVMEFDLSMNRFHNDSTSVSLSGLYRHATGNDVRAKRTVNLTFGHSKDHRRDLKQLVWILTVTGDGAVPVHYTVKDGNTNDSPTHIESWEAIHKLTGRTDFLYIADSKLCSDLNMQYIDSHSGLFLTILPATRNEYGLFREWMQSHPEPWEATIRGKKEERGQVWKLMESPLPSSDNFRIVWAWSSQKAQHDLDVRQDMMRDSILRIERLETRLRNPRCRLRTLDDVRKAAEHEIGGSGRWVGFRITEETDVLKVQMKRGRPGPETEYRDVIRKRFHVEWKPEAENIDFDEICDGIFPFITNDRKISLKDLLSRYKYQPRIEKRHEQLKSVYGVAPVLLKNVDRIEGFLFVYFLALLIESLIEREVRNAMHRERIKSIDLYPEDRECESPTTDRVLGIFEMVQMHLLESDGKIVKRFLPELTGRQKKLLEMAGVPERVYQVEW